LLGAIERPIPIFSYFNKDHLVEVTSCQWHDYYNDSVTQ